MSLILLAISVGTLGGCNPKGAPPEPPAHQRVVASTSSASATTEAPPSVDPSNAARIARAKERLAAGHDVEPAREVLEEISEDSAATAEDRDEATLALSVALEREGDRASAAGLVERLMRARGKEPSFRLAVAARTRLGELSAIPPEKFEAAMPVPDFLRDRPPTRK